MLDFSDNPLFTPPLSGDVQMVSQEDSTDSLDKVTKDKGRLDLSDSHTEPSKDRKYSSFRGKQSKFKFPSLDV
jgi:hypothetical protein